MAGAEKTLIDKVPNGHWKTMTFIAGLTHSGIVAPCMIDDTINGDRFFAWVGQFFIPSPNPDRSSLSTTSAVTRPIASGGSSATLEERSSSCRRTLPTLIRSSRSSRSSNGYSERQRSERSKAAGGALASCSTSSPQTNAQATSGTPVMRPIEAERL
jgi:hypothetical protein